MRRLSTLPRRGWLLAAAGVLILLVAAGMWLRDSSLVAVEEVAITGASGPDAPKIEAALRAVARDMTTLHIREDQLRQAVESFPTVGDIDIERDFPDALRIEVIEREPVAVIGEGDDREPVTAGGTVLRGATAPDDLPTIDEDDADRVLELLGAAPRPLLRRAERAFTGDRGLTVQMADGPEVYFGTSTGLEAKWAAAARVLADPAAEGATYVDVRVPARSAAGGVAPVGEEDETTDDGLTTDPATGAPVAETPPVDPAATAPPVDPAAAATPVVPPAETAPATDPETVP